MSDRRLTTDYVEGVLVGMLRLNTQLVGRLSPNATIDLKLVDSAPKAARQLLDELRLGEIKVDRWAPPPDDDETEIEIG